jgi:hypothetical protein
MTQRNSMTLLTAGLSLFFVMPVSAQTQPAQSFEQLQVLVKPGDSIYVRDWTGATSKAKILGLSSSSLQVMTKSGTRDISEADVSEIKQWRKDSLANGALIGLAGGATIGVVGAAYYCGEEGDHCPGVAAAMIGLWSAIGAGVGVGIDALIPHKRTIYSGAGRISHHFGFTPVLGGSRKGVAVRFSF